MTAASLSNPQIAPRSSSANPLEDADSRPPNWGYLVPTIGVLATGAFFAPSSVPIGMALGVGLFAKSCVVLCIAAVTNSVSKEKDKEGDDILENSPTLVTLILPALEEGIFRGLLLPLSTRIILFIVPAAAAGFLGTGLSIAATVSIVATAALFGLVHLSNGHKNVHIQAFSATLSGIAYGVAATQFGLAAPIAAHIMHNTLVITVAKLAKMAEKMIEKRTASSS